MLTTFSNGEKVSPLDDMAVLDQKNILQNDVFQDKQEPFVLKQERLKNVSSSDLFDILLTMLKEHNNWRARKKEIIGLQSKAVALIQVIRFEEICEEQKSDLALAVIEFYYKESFNIKNVAMEQKATELRCCLIKELQQRGVGFIKAPLEKNTKSPIEEAIQRDLADEVALIFQNVVYKQSSEKKENVQTPLDSNLFISQMFACGNIDMIKKCMFYLSDLAMKIKITLKQFK